jgi:hypothetical protein
MARYDVLCLLYRHYTHYLLHDDASTFVRFVTVYMSRITLQPLATSGLYINCYKRFHKLCLENSLQPLATSGLYINIYTPYRNLLF